MAKGGRGGWYSDEELQGLAAALRRFFGLSDEDCFVDVVRCFRSHKVWTIEGIKRLVLSVVADDQMIGTDAEYTSDVGQVFVKVRESVFLDAVRGKHRARMTLAHELGHIVLGHQGRTLARLTGVKRATPMSPIVQTFERPASAFGSFFLVNIKLAQVCESAEQISVKFGVSQPAAQIVWEKLDKRRNRKKILDGLMELSNRLSGARPASRSTTNDNAPSPANGSGLSEPAGSISWPNCLCGAGPMHPSGGNKLYCQGCGYLGDPPDGDSFGT